MNKRYGWYGLLLVGLGVTLTVYLTRPHLKTVEGVTVGTALGGDDNAGYQRAYQPRPFRFPD
ncbi:MAG TPA: hypothetical protein P5330_12370, partial [Candidatus Competibacteraceae bacterium]|nr:hypothetical protein [Candidatus Competibacteraceae bacterium]